MVTLMEIPRSDAGSLTGVGPMKPVGVGLAGAANMADQFQTLIVNWNTAYFLSKPAPVRAMMMLRQRGQGAINDPTLYETEAQALQARLTAYRNLDPAVAANVDELIDVYHAGFNAYETLSTRASNPFGVASPMPNLAVLPTPANDVHAASSEPCPFSPWIRELSPSGDNGPGAQYDPLSSDTKAIGQDWSGDVPHGTGKGTYVKQRFLPYGLIMDRWVRVK